MTTVLWPFRGPRRHHEQARHPDRAHSPGRRRGRLRPERPGAHPGAAPWQDGEKAIYDIVDANGSKIGSSEYSFAGDGDAWHVEGDFGQSKQSAWYAVAAPYTMLQYDAGSTKMVLSK
ncbi:MAG TPA: hypothetical protein PLJ35_08440 [Anaerolineae bacterium]|nr:hypothetical protein [Anaerolineae bacterium]HOQ98836.1 hypothetical protein [Anaerolineae bacterium]